MIQIAEETSHWRADPPVQYCVHIAIYAITDDEMVNATSSTCTNGVCVQEVKYSFFCLIFHQLVIIIYFTVANSRVANCNFLDLDCLESIRLIIIFIIIHFFISVLTMKLRWRKANVQNMCMVLVCRSNVQLPIVMCEEPRQQKTILNSHLIAFFLSLAFIKKIISWDINRNTNFNWCTPHWF